jgi:hypothetical protein
MNLFRRTLFFLLVATPCAADPQQADLIQCAGPFAKNSSHSRLAETFGVANLEFGDIGGAEGESQLGSRAFPNEVQRRFDVTWNDEAGRRDTKAVRFRGSAWRTVQGIGVGADLIEVERINGKPFTMWGFEWDYGGIVRDWQGGALGKFSAACRLGMQFVPGENPPPVTLDRVSGERTIVSSSPDVRAVKPRVSEIFLVYPE